MNRQTFLRMIGTGIIGTTLLPDELLASPSGVKPKISLQLYTVRNEIAKDLEGTLKRIADMGFKYVETAFWPKEISLEKAASTLKKAGLKVSSCHIELPAGDNKEVFLQTAKAFNCKKMIWHGWPEDKRYSSPEGTKELIKIYNEAAAFAKSNGLEFGLHNHWWEYRNIVGGKPVYEWLLKETDPSIFFEIDTYWVKVAGFTPAQIVKKFGPRAKLLHMKDGPARWNDKLAEDNPDPMTSLGKGTQNVPAIVGAAQYADFLVVEMDKVEGDVFQKIKESYDYLHQKFKLG
ncbi:MAG: sugar phosphate isomerase/epimerase [Sphingobacteriales bacterium]|nr:sugar phosphate isomerase/epimerase [Sphingobacteriales bacterium]